MDQASANPVQFAPSTYKNTASRLPVAVSVASALAAGLALRVWMLLKFPQINGDSLIYGGLAKNLLLHGQFAITDGSGVIHPTLIRLPGYPLFLAACFRIFGMENYFAVSCVQFALDLAACLLLADFVRRISSTRAAHCTLWLAALCPFTAIYASAPLTETPTLFVIALALWSVQRFREKQSWPPALLFTFAATFAALLRPDGALVGACLAPALITGLKRSQVPIPRLTRIAAVCLLLALTPFALWTARNWRVFQVIEPLAPRYATDPGEDIHAGWQRWVKTWCLDFVSTYYVYWNVPGDKFNLDQIPARAFDSPAQRAQTAALAQAYEDNGEDLSPELDAQFAQLAQQRIAAYPLRYYVWLPLGRLADMWLRPRVENLPIDYDWWVYSHHYAETRFSWFYAALNAFYIVLGMIGLCLRPRLWPYMLAYFVLRSALLATIEAPEARYTLECFPMLFALGGIALYRVTYCVFESVLKVKASLGSA
jgi:hypothetical protein